MSITIWSNINLKIIPVDIDQYFHVSEITLEYCPVTKVPNEIYNIKKLTYLSLTKSKISSLPTGISKLINLKSLILSDSNIVKIPCEVYSLRNLTTLDFLGCPIASLPHGISNLTNLKKLDVGNLVLNKSNIPYDLIPIIKNNTITRIGHGKNVNWEESMETLKNIVEIL